MNNSAEQYRLLAVDYAEKEGEANRLEEKKKIVFAELVNQFRRDEKAVVAAEYKARAAEPYKDIIDQYTAARTAANIAKAELRAKEIGFETWRTKEATKRTEMRL